MNISYICHIASETYSKASFPVIGSVPCALNIFKLNAWVTMQKCSNFTYDTSIKSLHVEGSFIVLSPFNSMSSQFYACTSVHKIYQFCRYCIQTTQISFKSLNWCRLTSKCWHNSACNCKIVLNISLQSACCLPSIETMSKICIQRWLSTKSVTWHFIVQYTIWNDHL